MHVRMVAPIPKRRQLFQMWIGQVCIVQRTATLIAAYAFPPSIITDNNIHCALRRYLLGTDDHLDAIAERLEWFPYITFSPHEPTVREFGPIEEWDTSLVTSMRNLFLIRSAHHRWHFVHSCTARLCLARWDTSRVVDMSYMFANWWHLPTGIGSWNVCKVRSMRGMFCGASRHGFTECLARWDVSQVTDMSHMFQSCGTFDQSIAKWNLRSLQHARNMFSVTQTEWNQWQDSRRQHTIAIRHHNLQHVTLALPPPSQKQELFSVTSDPPASFTSAMLWWKECAGWTD